MIAADRLKKFVERIERLREEKKAIGSDERDVFSEAKGVGFDTKAMREVLKRRAMEPSSYAEWSLLVDTYEHALGSRGEAARIVSGGGTYDEAASKTGLSRATVARTVASIKNLKNETEGVTSIGGDAGHRSEPSGPAAQAVNPDPPSALMGHVIDGQGAQSGNHSDDLAIPKFLDRRVPA